MTFEDTEIVNTRIWTEFTERNKADTLTRIKKNWMKDKEGTISVCVLGYEDLKELHGLHHMGVERILYLVRKIDPDVKKESVQKVVKLCTWCQSIDPSPNTHEPE